MGILQHPQDRAREARRVADRRDLAHAGQAHGLAHAREIGRDGGNAPEHRLHLHEAERLGRVDRGQDQHVRDLEQIADLLRRHDPRREEPRRGVLQLRFQTREHGLAGNVPGARHQQDRAGEAAAHHREGVHEHRESLLLGEAAEEEEHGLSVDAEALPRLCRGAPGLRRIGDRRANPADLLDPFGERTRVARVILGVGDDARRALEREVLRDPRHALDEALPRPGRRLQVAVERDDHRDAQRRGERRERDRVDERRVQMQHVGARDLRERVGEHRRRDERLAEADGDRRPHDADAVLLGLDRKVGDVPVGQHAHRVAAPREALRQVLGVERQPRHVRPVVVDRHQDLHFGRATA